MKRLLIAGTGLFLFLGVFQALPYQNSEPAAQGDYTIRTTSRLVLLDVSVKNTAGGFVSGLTKENFQVYEDGKSQTITQFANSDIPVSVGILVDESGSMRPKRTEVLSAALAFVTASNPQDETFVINFNERPRRGLPDTMLFSDDIDLLRKALWSGMPQGRTALYDALVAGLKQLEMGRRDKKTLVLISDGGDNISSAKYKDVWNMVLDTVATIYTIGVFDEEDPDKNPGLLTKLAQVSGGEAYFPQKLPDIIPICKKIAQDVRNRYTIGYIPEQTGKRLRHIKVSVSAPSYGKLIARTRTTYVMPEEADRTQ